VRDAPFFSNMVVAAADTGGFDRWFQHDFRETLVLRTWGARWSSCRRYYEALGRCRREAFMANARGMFAGNQPAAGQQTCATGALYESLAIPRVFCWGEESLAQQTQRYLESSSLSSRMFAGAGHWVMVDRAADFYRFCEEYVAVNGGGRDRRCPLKNRTTEAGDQNSLHAPPRQALPGGRCAGR